MNEKQIYGYALAKFGSEYQIGITQEECAELIQALSKFKRYDGVGIIDYASHVAEEIADVEIMIGQMRMLFGSQKVDEFKVKKLERLYKLVMNPPILLPEDSL